MVYYSPKDTEYQCNSYIYTFVNKKYEGYKILATNDTHLTCNPIGIFQKIYQETPYLNWNSVGVFKKGGVNSIQVEIEMKKIEGKMILVNGLLITCPNNVLREK